MNECTNLYLQKFFLSVLYGCQQPEHRLLDFFFFENLVFLLPWSPIKISDLDKIHIVGRGLLQKHFSNTFVKISAVTQK